MFKHKLPENILKEIQSIFKNTGAEITTPEKEIFITTSFLQKSDRIDPGWSVFAYIELSFIVKGEDFYIKSPNFDVHCSSIYKTMSISRWHSCNADVDYDKNKYDALFSSNRTSEFLTMQDFLDAVIDDLKVMFMRCDPMPAIESFFANIKLEKIE